MSKHDDRFEPVPVPIGDGRHDIGDDVRAAIVQRLISDWSHDPDLTPEKVRQLAMWAGASVRALLHEMGTLQDAMSEPAPPADRLDTLEARLQLEVKYCKWETQQVVLQEAADTLAALRAELEAAKAYNALRDENYYREQQGRLAAEAEVWALRDALGLEPKT